MPVQKILLVDDSKTELHFLSELLTKRGYNVRTAESGEEAMRRLAEDKPDLILMDVVMPGQNGFQLTRTITRDPRFTGVPVIMNTSFNLKGEPIVESPAHAFNTFSLSGMDLLFLNNYVVRAPAKKKIAETVFHLRHEGDSVTAMVS